MASLSQLATLLLCTFFCCCQSDLIADVCSKATNPSLCTQVLKSDPRTSGADLRGLGQIIIEKSTTATNDTLAVAKSFSGGNNTGVVDVCSETCIHAIDVLHDCSQLLKDFDGSESSKSDLKNKGSAALTNVATCDDAFEESGGEPPQVKEASEKAKDLIDVFLVVANSL
ncbi:hypothetical protein C2S51_037129 [Perilla frutescens var. frutescens]|nr:hypothetical protein C2S51_037129 [Perilla frutescens var. frutescens]